MQEQNNTNNIIDYVACYQEKPSSFFWKHIIARIIIICVIVLCSFFIFEGCAVKEKEVVKYQLVNVPVKCEVEKPERPASSGDLLVDNALIMKYTEELEIALEMCL